MKPYLSLLLLLLLAFLAYVLYRNIEARLPPLELDEDDPVMKEYLDDTTRAYLILSKRGSGCVYDVFGLEYDYNFINRGLSVSRGLNIVTHDVRATFNVKEPGYIREGYVVIPPFSSASLKRVAKKDITYTATITCEGMKGEDLGKAQPLRYRRDWSKWWDVVASGEVFRRWRWWPFVDLVPLVGTGPGGPRPRAKDL